MGICCPKAARVHPDWFFTRHGKKVHDRSRWQLDFRNPEVVEHANEVVDRLVRDYHVGYIKMDYNIEPGIGTELNADSVGDGLLGHERAYLAWLDSVFARYPDLVIENCSSGGMRIDYAMLSRHSIQSTSDQEDYLRYASIAANAPSGLTPEQSAIWSYPMKGGGREEAVFNMCNALMQRIHQSGHLAEIPEEDFTLVKEALDYYKTIRGDIKRALPFWPLGTSHFADTWVSLGLKTAHKAYITVWRRGAPDGRCTLPVDFLRGNEHVNVRCAYPANHNTKCAWNPEKGTLTVDLPPPSAPEFLSWSIKPAPEPIQDTVQNPDADDDVRLADEAQKEAEEARQRVEEAQKRAERAAQKMEDAMKRAKLAQEQLKKRRQRPKSSKIRTKRRKKSPAGTKNGCLRAMVFEFYFSMSFSTFCGAVGEEAGCTGICAEAAAGAETGA